MSGVLFRDLCGIDCNISDVSAMLSVWNGDSIFNYEYYGRAKNLLYYQLKGHRDYYVNGQFLLRLNEFDVLFIPDGYKYLTTVPFDYPESISSGIGIAFRLLDEKGADIPINEPLEILAKDSDGQLYDNFQKILSAVLHRTIGNLRAKGEIYKLLDVFSSNGRADEYMIKDYQDIFVAIDIIENHPERNITNKELAELCFMSESTFSRRFKQYSGGLPPLQYRNNIRIMRVEELLNTSRSIENIAQLLGFYDAAHLCRIYKKHMGKTLRNKTCIDEPPAE